MTDHLHPEAELEIAHVLFIDVVGYSTLLINEQTAVVGHLTRLVRDTPHFKAADAAAKLIRIPTGDGMALVFFNSPEAPVHCAIELAQALRRTEKIHVRMGIHSGPVHSVVDVNGQTNVTGQGINTAQRVMDCADGGHILLSKRVAEDLSHHGKWRSSLHPLGEVEAKHGEIVSVVNLYGDNYGNPALPRRVCQVNQPANRPLRRWLLWIGILALGLIIAAAASLQLYHSRSSATATFSSGTQGKSIAVLPFDNFSEDKQNAYFADGIQDDILTALAKVADLKVISRSSVMRYRDTNRDLPQIARELDVSHLLQGSVRRAGDEIRVTAQLIDARTNNQVWAEHYDRKLSDIFEIQSDVAHEIVNRLKATISPAEKAAIALRPTNDLEAFDLFLQAKQMIIAFDDSPDRKQTLLRAIRLLDEAIERDGKFALAYSWAAIAHDNLYWFDLDHTPARLQLAESCVRSALQLNPQLGEAHLAQGLIAYHGYRDYTKARQYLDTARRLLPNSAEVFSLIGYIDRRQGHWDDSVRNLQHAAELDPRNFKVLTGLSVLYDLMRRYDDKERLYDRAIEINPASSDYFQLLRAETELEKGDATKAASLLDKLPAPYDPDGAATAARIALSLSQNNTTSARAALERCKLEELVGATGSLLPRSYFDGQIARAENDVTKMRAAFSTAREKVESKLQADPDNGLWHGVLCVVEAGLSLKSEAITAGQKAVSLLPVTRDAVDGPVAEAYLAMGYAWVGEKDSAIKLLTDLATRPGGPTYGELLLDPAWRDVRSDPRFQQMLVKLKPGGR